MADEKTEETEPCTREDIYKMVDMLIAKAKIEIQKAKDKAAAERPQ